MTTDAGFYLKTLKNPNRSSQFREIISKVKQKKAVTINLRICMYICVY